MDDKSTLLIRDLDRDKLKVVQAQYNLPSLAATVRFMLADWMRQEKNSQPDKKNKTD